MSADIIQKYRQLPNPDEPNLSREEVERRKTIRRRFLNSHAARKCRERKREASLAQSASVDALRARISELEKELISRTAPTEVELQKRVFDLEREVLDLRAQIPAGALSKNRKSIEE